MSLPILESLPPRCYLYIEHTRFADGQPTEADTDPVALTGLSVTWGRDNTLDQPEPGTCSFKVLDVGGGVRFTDLLRIGSHVEVKAAATIYPDPTVPVFTFDPSFEAMAAGSVPPSTVTGGTVTVSTDRAAAGTKSAKIVPDPETSTLRAVFPPAPFGGVSAWDAVPRTQAGQSWTFGASVWAADALGVSSVVRVRPVAFTAPTAASAVLLDPILPASPAGGWVTVQDTIVPPAEVWLGLAVEVLPAGGPQWDEVPDTLTWDDAPAGLRWDDIGVAYADALVLLAPATGALRQGSVFAGRVTDMRSRYDLDLGGTLVDVTAQTHLAELDNRYVGDVPWLSEPLSSRFGKIVAASGQTIEYTIDSSVASVPITWRDVDSRPAGDLLHQLAQSVGGALWSAASDTGGAFIWLEDINQRPATRSLQNVGGVVVIVPIDLTGNPRIIDVDACDVLLEPLEWTQTTEDDSTRVVVTWQEQTLDTEGNPDPTSRDYMVTNLDAEAKFGRRRVQISTELAAQSDAAFVAESVLARLTTPGWRLSGLTWDVAATDTLNADTLDRIMTILDGTTRLGLGIKLTNVPDWAPPATGSDVYLFVEGGTFVNLDGAWELELLTSSAISQGEGTVRWDDLPGATAPVATRTNRATNPRAVSTGANGWTTGRWFGTGGAGTYSYATALTPEPAPGVTTARRKTWTTAATANDDSGFQILATSTTLFPVTAGQNYAISAYVRHTSSGSKNMRPQVSFHDAGGAMIGGLLSGSIVAVASGTAWTRLYWMAAPPANATGIAVYMDAVAGGTAWNVGAVMECTGLLIEQAGSLQDFFDGATPDAPPIDYAWTGTANASASTRTDTTPTATGWRWDDFDPAMTWNDLYGVGMG
jgi:hypothetical protein